MDPTPKYKKILLELALKGFALEYKKSYSGGHITWFRKSDISANDIANYAMEVSTRASDESLNMSVYKSLERLDGFRKRMLYKGFPV